MDGRLNHRVVWVALVVMLGPSIGCTVDVAAPPAQRASKIDPRVRKGDFQNRVLLTGEIQAVDKERIVVPRTPTWRMPITWMEADGAFVNAGQRVLALDHSEFSGSLEETRLEEARALNDLRRKEADIAVELADKEFEVEKARIQLEKARIDAAIPVELRSRREHQDAQLALTRAGVGLDKARESLDAARQASDAEVEELRITLASAREKIREAEEAIEAVNVKAPRDGILVVGENPREGRKFQVTDSVWVGLEVMSIPDLNRMKVEALLSDVDDGRIAIGMRARCTLDTYPDLIFEGRVEEITPIAKEQGWESRRRVFRVSIPLDESDPERMRPGMSVKVEIVPDTIEDVLLAPRAALDLAARPPVARLANGSRAEVDLGPCNTLECVIEQGLDEGARLEVRR